MYVFIFRKYYIHADIHIDLGSHGSSVWGCANKNSENPGLEYKFSTFFTCWIICSKLYLVNS